MSAAAADKLSILCVSFSADHASFAVGTTSGFQVFWTETAARRFGRDPFVPNAGGVGHVQLMYNSSVLLLAGGGPTPKFPPNKVMAWDDASGQLLAEIELSSAVRSMILAHDRLFVATAARLAVFSLSSSTDMLLTELDTDAGAPVLAAKAAPLAVVYSPPGARALRLLQQRERGAADPLWPLVDHSTDRQLVVADSAVTFAAFSRGGALLATASEVGTIVRVWELRSLKLVHQFRRGMDQASIAGIVFSPNDDLLLVYAHDRPTAHLFSLSSRVANRSSLATRAEAWWSTVSTELDCLTITSPAASPAVWSFASPARDPAELSLICVARDGTWSRHRLRHVGTALEPVGPPLHFTFHQESLRDLIAS